VKGAGPLAGIHAGLRSCGAEWGVFVAVDMPGVEAEHLRRLMERAEGEGLMASVAVDAVGRMHPLLGVYRRDLAEVLGRELAAGERAVWRVVERVCGVGLVRVEFEDAVLRNVNTPEDLGGAG